MFLHDSKLEELCRYNSGTKNGIKRKEYRMSLLPQFMISRIKLRSPKSPKEKF